jgi:hypothetical protein
MRLFSTLLALYASQALATIGFTYPDTGDIWDISSNSTLDITWITNGGDPSSARLVLVNPVIYPPYDIILSNSTAISQGSFKVTGIDPPAGYYRFEFQDENTNRTVLAESGTFNITGGTGTTPDSPTETGDGSTGTSTSSTETSTSTSTGQSTGQTSGTSTPAKSSSHAAAIGAGVGVPVGLLLIATLVFFIWRSRNQSRKIKLLEKKDTSGEEGLPALKAELPTHSSEKKKPSANLEESTSHELSSKEAPKSELPSSQDVSAELAGQKENSAPFELS